VQSQIEAAFRPSVVTSSSCPPGQIARAQRLSFPPTFGTLSTSEQGARSSVCLWQFGTGNEHLCV
jgi:hypothetical protein